MPVTLEDIKSAARRIAGGLIVSPCPESIPLGEATGSRVYCKLDSFQRTGSFKERGARNALLRLPAAGKKHGVVAASAGNHALGLAYHGRLLGIPVTVVMPAYAPLIKIATCRRLGARVILHGDGLCRGAGRGRPARARRGADPRARVQRSRHHRRPGHDGAGNPPPGARMPRRSYARSEAPGSSRASRSPSRRSGRGSGSSASKASPPAASRPRSRRDIP